MLAEVSPFRDPATGKNQLEYLLRRVESGDSFNHAVLPWLNGNELFNPALIFDIGQIEDRMRWLKQIASPLSVIPLVAVKSCPDPEYLKLGNRHLGGFDVSNSVEYSCLPDDLAGKLVSITAPDLNTDFRSFTTRGNTAVVALDSLSQLNHYVSQGARIPYVLRVQGSDLLKNMNPPDPAYFPVTRFGFSVDEIHQVLQHPQLRTTPPVGFHVHHGSERNAPSTYRTIIAGLSQLAKQLPKAPTYINLGGGWHGLHQDEISGILETARQAFPLPCSIVLEPGRWYAENAGFATGRIVNHHQTGNTVKYTLNLSGRCHLHWSTVKLVQPVQPDSGKVCEAQFFGASCYEADTIGKFLLPYRNDFYSESGLTQGRQVIFSGVSTYSAAWNTSFNGIPKAEIIWWRQQA